MMLKLAIALAVHTASAVLMVSSAQPSQQAHAAALLTCGSLITPGFLLYQSRVRPTFGCTTLMPA